MPHYRTAKAKVKPVKLKPNLGRQLSRMGQKMPKMKNVRKK